MHKQTIKKLWYFCTMEYYLEIKSSKILMHGTWIDLKNITLSERSQHNWLHNLLFHLLETLGKAGL